jgi:hypothetical protein
MTLKKLLSWIPIFLIAYWSLEIIFRRWYWEQIPTQVGSPVVYFVLSVNLLVISFCILAAKGGKSRFPAFFRESGWRGAAPGEKKRKGKS